MQLTIELTINGETIGRKYLVDQMHDVDWGIVVMDMSKKLPKSKKKK